MSKIFETWAINFEINEEVCTIEHTPEFGELVIQGCGARNRITVVEDNLTSTDLINFIAALEWMKSKKLVQEIREENAGGL